MAKARARRGRSPRRKSRGCLGEILLDLFLSSTSFSEELKYNDLERP